MRILIIYSYFCTPSGSWSTRWYEFARRWVACGHDVQILSAPYEKSDIPSQKGNYDYNGIQLKVFNTRDDNRQSKLLRAWNAYRFAIKSSLHVLRNNYDLVLASSGPLSVAIPMIIAKRFKKNKTIFEVRDLWPDAAISMSVINNKLLIKVLQSLEKSAYQNADYVVSCSVGQQRHILKKYGQLNIECISNSSDSYLFPEIEKSELELKYQGKKLVLHLGSLGFIHNCGYWLDLAAEIEMSDICFVFIGDGNDRADLERIAKAKKLQNVEFVGIIPKTKLVQWTSIAVASLFSTHPTEEQETCSPNKIFDSLEAGLPLVQTTKGWIYEMVKHHKVGLNLDISNPIQAAKDLENYLSQPTELHNASIRAKQLAQSNYNRDSLSTQYLDLLNRIVA